MKYSQKEIALLFSIGEFENIMDYLSDGIVWNIIGENSFEGKKAVEENCKQTAAYFKTVQTNFKTNDNIVSENKVVITGTAEFLKDKKKNTFYFCL